MGWTTPKINWIAEDMATEVDMNRIFNNVEWLATHSDYRRTFSADEIVTLLEWSTMKDRLIAIAEEEQLEYATPDNRASYDNFNTVEDILSRAKGQNDARWGMYRYNHYAGKYRVNCGIRCGGHERDLYGDRINMRKYNHYAGKHRVNSGIYSGGYQNGLD